MSTGDRATPSRGRSAQQGQALILAILVLVVGAILSSTLGTVWQMDLQADSTERDGLLAFYLSQGGVEHAKAYLSAIPPNPPIPVNGIYTSLWTTLGAGRYRFTITHPPGPAYTITSTGRTLVAGNVVAERRIQTRYQ